MARRAVRTTGAVRLSHVAAAESAIDGIVGDQPHAAALHDVLAQVLSSAEEVYSAVRSGKSAASAQVPFRLSPEAARVLAACGVERNSKCFTTQPESLQAGIKQVSESFF
ncbi:unnamed protein product [Effrenium voratum]|nr:unnamed protein product [Effrenium voratum]